MNFSRSLLALLTALLFAACNTTGGRDAVKPDNLDLSASYTIYLRGDPTFYDMAALRKALGTKPRIAGKTIDLRGGKVSGKKLKKPKSRDDEDAVAWRLRIPGLTVKNGIIDSIPGGIVCGREDCSFHNLVFTNIGEDALSNNSDKSRNMRVTSCYFLNDSGGDKSLQYNDATDCLAEGNYFTGGITGVRVQESTAKAKGTIRFTGRENQFVNVPTAWNIDGPKAGRTEATMSGNSYRNVEKRYVLRERAKVIEK